MSTVPKANFYFMVYRGARVRRGLSNLLVRQARNDFVWRERRGYAGR